MSSTFMIITLNEGKLDSALTLSIWTMPLTGCAIMYYSNIHYLDNILPFSHCKITTLIIICISPIQHVILITFCLSLIEGLLLMAENNLLYTANDETKHRVIGVDFTQDSCWILGPLTAVTGLKLSKAHFVFALSCCTVKGMCFTLGLSCTAQRRHSYTVPQSEMRGKIQPVN